MSNMGKDLKKLQNGEYETSKTYDEENPNDNFDDIPPEIIDGNRLLEYEGDDDNWIIPGLLPVGLTILAGDPKAGKSRRWPGQWL